MPAAVTGRKMGRPHYFNVMGAIIDQTMNLPNGVTMDPKEIEADKLAGEILIPSSEWQASPASKLRSADAANHLAQRLKIHPAIVAGRIRKTYKDYRVLSGMIGQGDVRKHFPEFQE